jgi:hypothetical protein
MADEMRLPVFRGDGSEYLDQHWFLCKVVWRIKKVVNEVVKRAQFNTTLRDHALSWHMKFVKASVQPKALNGIKTKFSAEFKNPKLDSRCITDLKEIKQKVNELVWEFDQRFKTLIGYLSFQILDDKHKEWFIISLLPNIIFTLMKQKVSSQAEALDISMKLEATPV